MSEISRLLQILLDAEFGEEVRDAIHDAINRCYLDATAGMVPDITVTAVEGGHNVTVSVGDVTTTFYVANGLRGPAGESGTATDAQVAAWLSAHPEATTTVGDNAITNRNIADNTIRPEKFYYNMAPVSAYSGDEFEANGLIIERNPDGSYQISGVATAETYYYLVQASVINKLKPGTYTMICFGALSNTFGMTVGQDTYWYSSGPTIIELDSESTYSMFFKFPAGYEASDTLYPLLLTGRYENLGWNAYTDPMLYLPRMLEVLENHIYQSYTKDEIDDMMDAVDIGLTAEQIAALTGLLD